MTVETEKKEINTDIVHIEIVDDIVYVSFKAEKITRDVAEKIVKMRLKLVGDNSYPTLVDARHVKSIDKESRDCFASKDAEKGVAAGALITDSVFNTFMANFFLRVTYNKSKIPTRLFTNKDEALKWLRQFMKNE